jgi:hypothetical protein
MLKNKVYYSLILLLILPAVVLGILNRFSYSIEEVSLGNLLESPANIQVQLNEDETYIPLYFSNNQSDVSALRTQSDLIIKAKVTNERINQMYAIHSGVMVTEVYKGKGVGIEDRIYIYEPAFFNDGIYTAYGGYNMMAENDEYILFLKHLPIPEGYRYRGNEERTFIPVSSYFGKYPIQSSDQTKVLKKEEMHSYSQVKDYELLTADKEKLGRYLIFAKKVRQMDF